MSLVLHQTPVWVLSGLLGLSIGSFLNVVIWRLPIMLERQWRTNALAGLEVTTDNTDPDAMSENNEPFNLLRPASCCPRCRARIAWHDNLPLLGWLKRLGRCARCKEPISLQYPLVELASGMLTLACVAVYGATLQTFFLTGACLTLLALAMIDIRTQLLPDILTLPLLWAGLIYQLIIQPSVLGDAVVGAILGYLVLWSLYWMFRLVTGKEGMGYGDFKLLAALGAWLGWQYLPMLLLLSAGIGALAGMLIQALIPELRGKPLPFGPWLALAGWVALLIGEPLISFSAKMFF